MGAVFKREFRSYLTKITGAVFIALSITVLGFFFIFTNILNTIPQIEYGLMGSAIALIFTIPFLCASLLAKENQNGNLKFLFSLPIKTHSIVLGKFLSAVAVFAIPTAIMSLTPLFLSLYGSVIFIQSYCSILSYFLIGCAFIAICLFISSQTKYPALSMLIGFLTLGIIYFSSYVCNYIPSTPLPSLVSILVVEVIVAVVVYLISKRILCGVATLGITAIPTVICYFISKNSFSSLFLKIVKFASPFERFSNVNQGIFRLSDVIYFLSITALFILFSYVSVERVRYRNTRLDKSEQKQYGNNANLPTRKTAKITSLATLCIIVLNLMICITPIKSVFVDASGLQTYSMSQNSEIIAKRADEDIIMYLLCENGIPDEAIKALLDKYSLANKHINYKIVDVTANPDFVSDYIGTSYDTITDGGAKVINNQSIIVKSEKRHTTIDSSNYYHYRIGSDTYTEEELQNYSRQLVALGYQALTAESYQTYFDADNLIATAIEYVTEEEVKTVYTLTGYGDRNVTSKFYDNLKYADIQYADLDLSSVDDIPSSCSPLIIVAPERDISDADTEKIINYIKVGGDIILISCPDNTKMANLLKITEEFGVTAKDGTIYDSDKNHYQENGEQYDLILNCDTNNDIVYQIKSRFTSISTNPRFPHAHAITRVNNRPDNVTISDMFSTSGDAYIVYDDNTSTTEGEMHLAGISSSISHDDTNTSELIWYSSYEAFTDDYLTSRPINMLYLLMSLSKITGNNTYESSLIIDSRNISGNFLEIQISDVYVCTILFVTVILVILGAGIATYVCRKFRKKI